MGIIIILFCICAAVTGHMIEKNIYNPITCFFVYWASVILLLSYGSYFGINKTSERAYQIIFVGLISYYIGCILSTYIRQKNYVWENAGLKGYESNYVLRYKMLYIIYSIVLLYLLYNSITVIKLLASGGSFADIRKLYTSREEYNILRKSAYNMVIKNFFSTPVVYLSLPVAVIDFFDGKKDKKLLIMTICMVGLWVLNSGGRSIILWFAMYFVCAILIYKQHNKLSRKMRRRSLVLTALLIVVLIFISTLRRDNFSIMREIFIYFAAPIPHFDYRISMIDNSYPGLYGYGMSSLNGLIYPILFAFKNLGLIPYPSKYLIVQDLSFEALEQTVDIGVRMNAFVTMFYHPYLDGRIIGVIIASLLFGFMCNWIYLRMKPNLNRMMVVLYLMIVQKLLSSVVRFYFFQPAHVISFVAIFFIFKKQDIPIANLIATVNQEKVKDNLR